VNNNPLNPVISERSFGEDPREVTRLAGAWMRGALREGVACSIKHFPGHGDTHVDSHRDLPVVDKPLDALQRLELLPFEALSEAALKQARARLDALAERFPSSPSDYAAAQHEADDALMRRAWAQGLTAIRGATPPPLDRPLRVFTQRNVPGDGVSEAGLAGEQLAPLFARFADVAFVQVDELKALDWRDVPRDGRCNVLVSNHRARYGDAARGWCPDLHLALWNPFQVLDVAAPAVVTWG